MYETYASAASNVPKNTTTPTPSDQPAIYLIMDNENDELHNFLCDTHETDQDETNDLEKYMAEQPPKLPRSPNQEIYVLLWWKNQQDEYPILSKVARDALAMQVSTIASKPAFNAGGCVLDPFRIRLEPEMVEALICTKD